MFVSFEVLNADEEKIYSLLHIAASYGDSIKIIYVYRYATETFRTKTAEGDPTEALYKQLVSFLYLTATVTAAWIAFSNCYSQKLVVKGIPLYSSVSFVHSGQQLEGQFALANVTKDATKFY